MHKHVRCFVWVLLLAGCDHGHPHPHAEAEEPKSAQITVWGERFEVFLEHRFIVANTPTPFVTHVTDLKTLEARRKDKVVFVQRYGTDAPIEHVENEPKRPGIYIPELTFAKAGEWNVTLRIPVDSTESVVELPKIVVYATKDEAQKAAEPEAPEGISFLKEQQWKVLTKSEPAGKRKLVERVRVPGTVSVRPGSRASVTPPIAGRLLVPDGESFPAIGDRVEAGQILALVQPPFSDFAVRLVEADAEVVRTKLRWDQAEALLARAKILAASQAKTPREVQEAEFSARTEKAAYDAAVLLQITYRKTGVTLSAQGVPILELKSPLGGVITQIAAALGEYVSTDRSVFSVLDISKVIIEARIAEADVARLGQSKAGLIELPDARGQFIPLLGNGRLIHLAPEVDRATRTVPLLYEVQNSGGKFRIGASLNLYLETARVEDALAIPVSSLVDEDARAIVFVQVSGEAFQKRNVTLGIRDGDWVQILDGVTEGERVVTKDAFTIRLASVSSVIPAHGHAH